MDHKIVIPLDGSKVGEAALPYIEDIISKLSPEVKTEVVLLQVIAPASISTVSGRTPGDIAYTEKQLEQTENKGMEYLNQIGETLRSKGVTVITKVVVGDASEQIVKVAEEIDANLIAMSTHGRSGFSRWAFGSVTDKVLRREGRIPIAMVRAPR
jgi:nucleotide-binding universal stress UspA family protein